MASGSAGGGYNRNTRGGGGRIGRKVRNVTAAMSRRLKHPNNGADLGFMAMNRKNRVRGEKNATVRSDYLPF